MKFTTVLLLLVVLVVAIAVVSGAGGKAERKAARKAAKAAKKAERKASRQNCKYDKQGAACDETMTPPKRVAQLIPEASQGTDCPPTKIFPCKGNKKNKKKMGRCKYNKKAATCDETMTPPKRVAQLIDRVSEPDCPTTKEFRCRPNRPERKMRCRYNLREGNCNEETQMKTVNLKKGDSSCPETKEIRCGGRGGRINKRNKL